MESPDPDSPAPDLSAPDLPAQGRFVGAEHRFPVRIYFEDTDLSGVVYHANYLRYMERARSDMLRLAGIDQRAFHDAGEGAYAVSAMSLKFRRPARLDDALVISSELTGVRTASVDIQQTVRRDTEILVEAEVTAALVSPSGRPRRQPAAWLDIYRGLARVPDHLGVTEGQ